MPSFQNWSSLRQHAPIGNSSSRSNPDGPRDSLFAWLQDGRRLYLWLYTRKLTSLCDSFLALMQDAAELSKSSPGIARLAGHEFPTLLVLAIFGSFISYIYSAPPLKLKQSGWAGNYALGSSYIALPWWAGQASLLQAFVFRSLTILTELPTEAASVKCACPHCREPFGNKSIADLILQFDTGSMLSFQKLSNLHQGASLWGRRPPCCLL